jgi:hypothetical protein
VSARVASRPSRIRHVAAHYVASAETPPRTFPDDPRVSATRPRTAAAGDPHATSATAAGPTLPSARSTPVAAPDAGGGLSAEALCTAIGAILLSKIEIEHYLECLHALYPSRVPSLEALRGDSPRDRGARLLGRVSRTEHNRACVRDLEFWLSACLRFLETAPALITPDALLQADGPRLGRAAADGRWAAANLKRLCHWLEREQAARRRAR